MSVSLDFWNLGMGLNNMMISFIQLPPLEIISGLPNHRDSDGCYWYIHGSKSLFDSANWLTFSRYSDANHAHVRLVRALPKGTCFLHRRYYFFLRSGLRKSQFQWEITRLTLDLVLYSGRYGAGKKDLGTCKYTQAARKL